MKYWFSRNNEYFVFLYRLALVFVFYFIARILFYFYNSHLLEISTIGEFLNILYRGEKFDISAIFYVNSLFIVLSTLPFFINTRKGYQIMLGVVYFVTNLFAYATNFADLIYYQFIHSRTTMAVMGSMENEPNLSNILWSYTIQYWHVILLYLLCAVLWIYLYRKVKAKEVYPVKWLSYILSSLVVFVIVGVLFIGGVRGDYKHSTRPINMVDASRHVDKITHADMVLNTPFSIIRTYGLTSFAKIDVVEESYIQQRFNPIKQYDSDSLDKKNIVYIIVESLSREYIGAFNEHLDIEGYQSYTPFLDSLCDSSLIFLNTYANGRKSIHAMSSMLAGIPSLKVAYTSSPYSTQKVTSLVSVCNEMGYNTSFYHGAPDGSMGFLGFSTILGFDEYVGKNAFNNDEEFDGIWGIWDEPFLQYFATTLTERPEPFFASCMTLTSHAPFIVPDKYEGVFPKGNLDMHQCVGYTDHSLRQFFKTASKQPWYDNTIFVITADHCNQVYYKEYTQSINHFAVPIIIYSPSGKYRGVRTDLAQQIDIYPTIVGEIGYNKPFRSWGRSLLKDTTTVPFVPTHNSTNHYYLENDLFCIMDDERTFGVYHQDDKAQANNLLGQNIKGVKEIQKNCKAFIQDYMRRVMDRDLETN